MHCIITFTHGRPQGGRERVETRPPPGKKIGGGAFLPFLWGPFCPCGRSFSILFGGDMFSMWAFFSHYVEQFLGLCPLSKHSAGAHALAAKIVANMCHLGMLKVDC